jgi:hypothetical protein
MLGAGELHAQAPRLIADGTVREGTLSFEGRATTGAFTGTTAAVRGEMSGGGKPVGGAGLGGRAGLGPGHRQRPP